VQKYSKGVLCEARNSRWGVSAPDGFLTLTIGVVTYILCGFPSTPFKTKDPKDNKKSYFKKASLKELQKRNDEG
jgi:hypothetical protein